MNAVDIGDQLRASNNWKYQQYRGHWQPLAWVFLLSTAYVNSYLLDSKFGIWKGLKKGHLKWREALVSQLFNTYTPQVESRKRGRPGRFDDKRNDNIELSLHQEGSRGKRAAYVVCSAVVKKRRPLGDTGSKENIRGPNTVWGCLTYDVTLYHTDFCWDLFYNSKLGVV